MAKANTKTKPKAAPAPKASIHAKAKLVDVKTATGEADRSYSSKPPGTAMVLTIKIPMGAPTTVPSWDEYKRRGGSWQRTDYIDREVRKIAPPPAKVPKAKKGEAAPLVETVPSAPSFDEEAARKRIGEQYDAELRTKWERECEKANATNARFMERAASFAMFAALRGTEVQVSISPVQQGFKDVLAGGTQTLALGAGDDDEGDDE